MAFHYPEVPQEGLRLLRPISVSRNLLSFAMTSYHRKAKPSYRAVSYTWGDGEPTERILINEQPFFVRPNLWSCLFYLGSERDVPSRYLWVDAICINQANTPERNVQVRAMDKIYREAVSVSVWLGLPAAADQYRYLDEPIRTFEVEPFDWFLEVEDLANRPYWNRFWVIQEFLLAQDVHLHCGNTSMHYSDFKDLLGFRAGTSDYVFSTFDYRQLESGSWAVWPLITGRHPDKHPELQQPLYELLINHCASQCKDPRDRVFALLGLVTLDERPFLEQFFPDYTMSEDDVVTIVLSYIKRINVDYDWKDNDRLFLGLGVECEQRRKNLFKRAMEYDCLMGIPPNNFPFDADNPDEYEADWNEMNSNSGRRSRSRRWLWLAGLFALIVLPCGIGLKYTRWIPKSRNAWPWKLLVAAFPPRWISR